MKLSLALSLVSAALLSGVTFSHVALAQDPPPGPGARADADSQREQISAAKQDGATPNSTSQKAEETETQGVPATPKPIEVDGVFVSLHQSDVSANHEKLTSLEIEKIIDHGSVVVQGQPLVWFETESLDKTLRDAEADLQLARIALEADEFAHQQFLQQQQLDRAAADRKRDHAQRDFDRFVKVDFPRKIAQAKQNLKSSAFFAESAAEEYKQLLQMYEEDDLTEQSEEIVLRRAKNSMEAAQFRHEGTVSSNEHSLKELLPRERLAKELALNQAMRSHAKSMHELDSAEKKRQVEMKRKRQKFHDQEKSFSKMRQERQGVVLTAAHDGIFLHGKLTRGKLSSKPVALQPKTKITGRQIVGTLVGTKELAVQVDLPESQLSNVANGMGCKITTKAVPDLEIHGKVRSVSRIGYALGKYDCVIDLLNPTAEQIVPTMACKVEFAKTKTHSESNQVTQEKE